MITDTFFHALLTSNVGASEVTDIGEKMAYTWFGRPNWAVNGNKFWIGSTASTASGLTQHISEFNLNTGEFTTTQVGTEFEYDDHNQAQILIRASDNRLVAFFVEHNGNALRWKISTNPLDATAWGDVNEYDPLDDYSYISPYQDSNGDVYVLFRSHVPSTSIFKWYYVKSTDDCATFGTPVEIIDNGATQNYCITVQDGDKIHFVSSDGHPENNLSMNVSMYHFYFDMGTETFHKSDGTAITLPMAVADTTNIITTTGNDTSWNLDITVKDGKPRILYAFYPSGRNTVFYEKELWFAEWDGTAWVNNTKISETMSGYIEKDAVIVEHAYTGGSRFVVGKPDLVIMPKQVNGVLELHKVDISILEHIYIEQLTFDSEVDNWRPICLDFPENNLLWLRNDRYDMYNDFDIMLMSRTLIL